MKSASSPRLTCVNCYHLYTDVSVRSERATPSQAVLLQRFNFFGGFARFVAVACLGLATPWVLAGSIGFSVAFSGDDVAITHTGNEAGYQFALYTLGPSTTWQRLRIVSGNAAYLLPGQRLQGRRQSPAAHGALGRADPLLLLFHDQAGSRIVQLAWRQTPAPALHPMKFERDGRLLQVRNTGNDDHKTMATYGIALPYEGIAQLARPLSAAAAPPNPLRHVWADRPALTLDTGAGQGGAWLLHQNVTGELLLQVVPDGIARGKEQVPAWLTWARRNLMMFAQVLAALGAVLLVAGLVGRVRRRTPAQMKA